MLRFRTLTPTSMCATKLATTHGFPCFKLYLGVANEEIWLEPTVGFLTNFRSG